MLAPTVALAPHFFTIHYSLFTYFVRPMLAPTVLRPFVATHLFTLHYSLLTHFGQSRTPVSTSLSCVKGGGGQRPSEGLYIWCYDVL